MSKIPNYSHEPLTPPEPARRLAVVMTAAEREERIKFLDLTPRDAERLRALRPLLERHIGEIEEAFYAHLLSFPEPRQLLSDRTTVERLKQLQRAYLLRITEGTFDEAYFEERQRIGQAHERVGLSPRWYLMSYSLYFRLIAPRIHAQYASQPDVAEETLLALEKVFMLDASLAMDAYIVSDRWRRLHLLENVFNQSADAILMVCEANRFRSWNRAAEELFGWREEEMIGKPLTVLVPADRIEAGELDWIQNQLTEKGNCRLETVRVTRDGRSLDVEVSVALIRDSTGRTIGRSAILRDITARRRAAATLRESEERLRSVMDNVVDGIITINERGVIQSFNKSAERIFRYTAEEVIGQNVSILMPEPDKSRHDGYIHNYIKTGEAHIIGFGREVTGRRKDGATFPMDLAVGEFHLEGKRMFTGVVRDISERKRMEEEKLHAERLALIGTMSAKLAHEIRNPLTSVIVNAHLLTRELVAAPDDTKSLLRSIDSEVQRIKRITEDYLKFARLPEARRKLSSLNSLIERQLPLVQPLLDQARVKLILALDPSMPVVSLDEEQIWQATLNLVRNAVDAMPEGGTLTIRTLAHPESVTLSVGDTGNGIPDDLRANIFKPFFSTKSGGTGLGLPLVEQIVLEHEGQIGCESTLGHGTTFSMDLPIAAIPTKKS